MNRRFNKIKKRLLSPFNNEKGLGYPQLILGMLSSLIVVSIIAWILTLIMHQRVEDALKTNCYKIVDGISEAGKYTASMQVEFNKGFSNTKYYTGDYTVSIYKYDYTNGTFSKTLLGTSNNGATIPEFSVAKGTSIQVVFKSKGAVPLDKMANVFTLGNPPVAGIAVESGGKVY